MRSLEPRPISTSRQPVLPRSVTRIPWSRISVQPVPSWRLPRAAIETDDFRAPQSAGEADQQNGAVAKAAEIAEIERRHHREQVSGQHRLLLLGRPALGASDAGEDRGDMAVGAVEFFAALREIPGQRRKAAFDRAHRTGLSRQRARGASGDIEADDLAVGGQGGKAVPAGPAGIVPPVGGVGAAGVFRARGFGVVARAFGEVLQLRRCSRRERGGFATGGRRRGNISRDFAGGAGHGGSHGLSTEARVSSKSPTLRVTTMRSWTIAVAAIRPSASPRGRSAAIRPHSTAIASVTGRMRSA